MQEKSIWTIGHSTRTIEEFISLLDAFRIEVLADIRSFPGSKRYPHFNKEELQASLSAHGIAYVHFKALGGRRTPLKDSPNTGWRNAGFRGYADHMETPLFKDAAEELEKLAAEKRVAYMCSEAVWWSCHRSLLSDYFKLRGWTVMHIMAKGKAEEHPYTKPAKIIAGKLSYPEEDNLFHIS